MGKNVKDIMKGLPKARREKIMKRGEELLAEYQILQDIRKAQGLTQVQLAEKLKINQDGVSKIEKRSDMLVSTLRGYIEAMGGELDITVKFPDQKPISIDGFVQE